MATKHGTRKYNFEAFLLPAQEQSGAKGPSVGILAKKMQLWGRRDTGVARDSSILGLKKIYSGQRNAPYSQILICTRTNPTSFSNFTKNSLAWDDK